MTKQAAMDGVKATIAQTISDAETDAALFGSYFSTFRNKQAAMPPDAEGGEDHGNPNDASSGASESGESPAGGGAPPADPGAGGAPPDMGGAPPMGEATPPMGGPSPMGGGMEAMAAAGRQKQGAATRGQQLAKLGEAVQKFKLSGRYQMKEASGPQQRQLRDQMKNHVRELLGL